MLRHKGGMGRALLCLYVALSGWILVHWLDKCAGKRVAAHQSGKGARYTRAHRPVALVYVETFDTKKKAMQREYQLKQLTKAQKEALVSTYEAKKTNLV